MERIKSVDILRGFSMFWMMVIQLLDFVSNNYIMSVNWERASPFWLITHDHVNWLPYFCVISGVSVWLMVTKRLEKGQSKLHIFVRGWQRYGYYITLSMLLCLWCMRWDTFIWLNEIIGAIGVYAFITLILTLIFYKHEWIFPILAVSLCFIGYYHGHKFDPILKWNQYRFYWMLPMWFWGVFFAKYIAKKDKDKLLTGSIMLFLFFVLFELIEKSEIRYSQRDFTFIIFNSALVILSFAILSSIDLNPQSWIYKHLDYFGRHSLFFYVFHLAVYFKLIRYTGLFQCFDPLPSIILMIMGILFMYLLRRALPESRWF